MARDLRLQRLLDRARELGAEGPSDEAAALLRGALERHPRDAELRLTLALEVAESEPAESLRLLEQAAELAHDDPLTLFRVASSLRAREAHEASVRAARRVGELVGEDDFLFAPDLQHLSGLLARDEGDDERAEPLLRAAFAAEPESSGHGRWLAGLLMDQDRYDEALDVVQLTLEHRPGDKNLLEFRDWLEQELS